MTDSYRVPVYGTPCGFRWPSEDQKDVHGCSKRPSSHVVHRCTCEAVFIEVIQTLERWSYR